MTASEQIDGRFRVGGRQSFTFPPIDAEAAARFARNVELARRSLEPTAAKARELARVWATMPQPKPHPIALLNVWKD